MIRFTSFVLFAALVLVTTAAGAQTTTPNVLTDFEKTNPNFANELRAAGLTDGPAFGHVFYVDSSRGTANAPGTRERPFNTIGAALSRLHVLEDAEGTQFVYNNLIVVYPEHTETITAASSLTSNTVSGIHVALAGTKIIGLGAGSDRPAITLSTATSADVNIAAEGVLLQNLVFVQGITALATVLDVAATADFLTLKDIEFTKSTTHATNTVDWINVAAGADDITFDGITTYAATGGTAGSVSLIEFAGANARPTFRRIATTSAFSDAVIDGDGAWTDALFDLDSFHVNSASVLVTRTGAWTEAHVINGEKWFYLENSVADFNGFDAGNVEAVWTVTGDVEVKVWNRVGTAITAGTADGEFQFGVVGDPDAIIGATEVAVLTAGTFWNTTTGLLITANPVLQRFVVAGTDIVFLIDGTTTTDDPTAGSMEFFIYWRPLGTDGGHVTRATIASGA